MQVRHIGLFIHATNGRRMSASDVFTHVGGSVESLNNRWRYGWSKCSPRGMSINGWGFQQH